MSEIGALIDRVVKVGLVPMMREAGFRKKGNEFWKTAGDTTGVLSVQKNRWNSSESGQFTVNLGVHFRRISEVMPKRFEIPDPPKEYHCVLRVRLGMLQRGRDHWWTVTPESNIETVAKELEQDCKEHALPWLERNKDLRNAALELEARQHYWHAAAARLVLDEKKQAERLVLAAIALVERDIDFQHPANAQIKTNTVRLYRQWAEGHHLRLE